MTEFILLDDTFDPNGGAQKVVVQLAKHLNNTGKVLARIMTSCTCLDSYDDYSNDRIIINCTDWVGAGFNYAEQLSKRGRLYLLSQISFFTAFARLYISYDKHLFLKRENAKKYYKGVITLNNEQNQLWSDFAWNTVCFDNLNQLLMRDLNPSRIVIAANHWNNNKAKDTAMMLAQGISDTFTNHPKCYCYSSDEACATPDEMFDCHTIYVHCTKVDVDPLTINEALARGAFVVSTDYVGVKYSRDNLFVVRDILDIDAVESAFSQSNRILKGILGYIDILDKYSDSSDNEYKEYARELTNCMLAYNPQWSDFGFEEPKPIKKRTKN